MTEPKLPELKLTPMEEQYFSVKKQYPDCLLFYRLGDFYELFNDDAIIASKILGLVLTHRQSMPMCGIPWHAHEMYLAKLVKLGYRIAICDQTETPEEAKLRGNKGPVAREVTRIVSSGTVIEDALLNGKQNNWLLAINRDKDKAGLAYTDVSSGEFFVEELSKNDVLSCIAKVNPAEIICSDIFCSDKQMLSILEKYKNIVHILPGVKYNTKNAIDRLTKFFGVSFIDSFGKYSPNVVQSISMIVDYISSVYRVQDAKVINLYPPKLVNTSDYMLLDEFTQKSLELTVTQAGERNGSLLSCLDTTRTTQGARMLARWINAPLITLEKIKSRLDYVDFFVNSGDTLRQVSEILKVIPDLERAISRIVMKKCGPRDIKAVQNALQNFIAINEIFKQNLKTLFVDSPTLGEVLKKLSGAIIDTPPLLARDGNFIQPGYDELLDEYNELLNNGGNIIKDLQHKYISELCIPTLKIKNNGVLGYFIEISPTYANHVPSDFIHRQTLGSYVRYTTKELANIANNIYSAEANARQRELSIFDELIAYLASYSDLLRNISDTISFTDVITSFARNAKERHYVRPAFNDNNCIEIKSGRHPVVEQALLFSGNKFTVNDYYSNNEITLITGPNMGGKSTYLRQNALIMIMAQIGSYVSADFANLPIIDRIFSRVGASDDIASGKSTFMVEMLETATILNQATSRSFVILDEVGRGTSTQDGVAIAQAVAEELANNIRVNTIFATHYHELINIKNTIPNIKFSTVKVIENGDDIVFLHKIVSGFAGKSFGLHVATLAGFPKHVLERAKKITDTLIQ